jgi:GNAT superfamily N-acetyltransferase
MSRGSLPKSRLIGMCRENLVRGFGFVARMTPGGVVERVGGLTVVRSGMAGSGFNLVFGLDHPESIEQVREGIERLFLRTKTEFVIVTLPETFEELEPLVRELNLTEREVFPGMVLDPVPDGCPDPPKELQVRRVSSPEEVADLLSTAALGFGVPPKYYDVWTQAILVEVADPRSRTAYYVGYVDDKPVTTSILFITGDVAGIELVSTIPEFRNRGFGEAIVWRAAADGRAAGCKLSYLQASKLGRPVYERMGYRAFEEYTEWKKPVQVDR